MLSVEKTKVLAELARLDLTEEECVLYSEQLGQILEHMSVLNEISTEGVLPIVDPSRIDEGLRLRPDQSQVFSLREDGSSKVMDCANDEHDGSFRVPLVIQD